MEHLPPASTTRARPARNSYDPGVDYLDLHSVHLPIAPKYVDFAERHPPEWFFNPEAESPKWKLISVPLHATWAAMESLVDSGLVRQIGGSATATSGLLHDLMAYSRIKPAMLQLESHPYLTQERLLRLAADHQLQ